MRALFDWLGGRKVIVFLLTFAFVVVTTFTKTAIPEAQTELIKWVGGLYLVGNGVNAVAHAVATRGNP